MFDKHFEKKESFSRQDADAIVEKINQLSKKFLGSKNYHNFTKKMKSTDPASKRFIIDFRGKSMSLEELLGEKVNDCLDFKEKKVC